MRIFNAWRPSHHTFELLTDAEPGEQDLRAASQKLDQGFQFDLILDVRRDVIMPQDKSGPVFRTTWSVG